MWLPCLNTSLRKFSSLQEWVKPNHILIFVLTKSTECGQGPQSQAYHASPPSTCHPRWRRTRHTDSRYHCLWWCTASHQPRFTPQGRAEEEEQGCWGLDVLIWNGVAGTKVIWCQGNIFVFIGSLGFMRREGRNMMRRHFVLGVRREHVRRTWRVTRTMCGCTFKAISNVCDLGVLFFRRSERVHSVSSDSVSHFIVLKSVAATTFDTFLWPFLLQKSSRTISKFWTPSLHPKRTTYHKSNVYLRLQFTHPPSLPLSNVMFMPFKLVNSPQNHSTERQRKLCLIPQNGPAYPRRTVLKVY